MEKQFIISFNPRPKSPDDELKERLRFWAKVDYYYTILRNKEENNDELEEKTNK